MQGVSFSPKETCAATQLCGLRGPLNGIAEQPGRQSLHSASTNHKGKVRHRFV